MKLVLLSFAALLISGCGSIGGTEVYGYAPFRGVKTDCRLIQKEEIGAVLIFDIPFSLAVDIVMLPVSTPLCGRNWDGRKIR